MIKNITVIGAGIMGNGICHVLSSKYNVNMMDVSQEAIDKAIQNISKNMDRQISKNIITEDEKVKALSRIKTFTNLEDAIKNADLVEPHVKRLLEYSMKIGYLDSEIRKISQMSRKSEDVTKSFTRKGNLPESGNRKILTLQILVCGSIINL